MPASLKNTSFYRMPAEWEKHRATWLSWPVNEDTWPGPLLLEVRDIYRRMIGELLKQEKVNLLVKNNDEARTIRNSFNPKTPLQRLVFHEVRTVDAWIRDYGPIFVKHGRKTTITKWMFNAWGGKYRNYLEDNRVVSKIKALRKIKMLTPGIVLEGGSIDVNGKGSCLTTEQCLLNPNRNSWLEKGSVEGYLGRYLGVRKVIWLKKGIEGDDTDGHIDDIARFVNPNTIVAVTEENRRDKNYAALQENLDILRSARDSEGQRFRVITLPMPGKVTGIRGKRLPASYANFYIANRVVLVPIFGHANDKKALRILQNTFTGRKVVGVNCTAMVNGLGTIHCVTQQEPA